MHLHPECRWHHFEGVRAGAHAPWVAIGISFAHINYTPMTLPIFREIEVAQFLVCYDTACSFLFVVIQHQSI